MPGKSSAFYRTPEWRALREQALRRDGHICQPCRRRGRAFVRATVVHHIKPRDTHPELAMCLSNLESACYACHNKEHPEKAFKAPVKKSKVKKVRIIRM